MLMYIQWVCRYVSTVVSRYLACSMLITYCPGTVANKYSSSQTICRLLCMYLVDIIDAQVAWQNLGSCQKFTGTALLLTRQAGGLWFALLTFGVGLRKGWQTFFSSLVGSYGTMYKGAQLKTLYL